MAIKPDDRDALIALADERFDWITDRHGVPYAVSRQLGNPATHRLGGERFRRLFQSMAFGAGHLLADDDLRFFEGHLIARAHVGNDVRDVYRRVAPSGENQVIIDVGDAFESRILLGPNQVRWTSTGCEALFERSPSSQAFVRPAEGGNWADLFDHLNMSELDQLMFVAWASYTLCHPKVPSTNFPILLLSGPQGSGKSVLCGIVRYLVDPSRAKVSIFPSNTKDLVIAAQNSHVLCYDNMRHLSPAMADVMCIAVNGGTLSARALYSDASEYLHQLHVALVLNGIHAFVDAPDLAQRCVTLNLEPLDGGGWRSEEELDAEFQQRLPGIFGGLLGLCSEILARLNEARIDEPSRMYEFGRWIAAMEEVIEVEHASIQRHYRLSLQQSMMDALGAQPLALGILSLTDSDVVFPWTGTSTQLLTLLEIKCDYSLTNQPDWPDNPTALGRRLNSIEVALRAQGIVITHRRAQQRLITIARLEQES